MKRSRIVIILEMRHEDSLNLASLKTELIKEVKDAAMPWQRGSISVGVSFDAHPDNIP